MPARLRSTSVGVWKGKEEEEEDIISKGNILIHPDLAQFPKCFACEKFLLLAKWNLSTANSTDSG